GKAKYNSLQIQLRRRYTQGLQFDTSYVFGHAYISDWESFRLGQFYIRDAGDPGDVTHQFKGTVVYDLPFGEGRRWGAGANPVLNRIIGGWQIGLTSRVQTGRRVDFGNVRMVGMTQKELQDAFQLRFDNAGRKVYMLPQDIIDNTIRAFSVSPTTPSGYAG